MVLSRTVPFFLDNSVLAYAPACNEKMVLQSSTPKVGQNMQHGSLPSIHGQQQVIRLCLSTATYYVGLIIAVSDSAIAAIPQTELST